jgi:hypothetical protein
MLGILLRLGFFYLTPVNEIFMHILQSFAGILVGVRLAEVHELATGSLYLIMDNYPAVSKRRCCSLERKRNVAF